MTRPQRMTVKLWNRHCGNPPYVIGFNLPTSRNLLCRKPEALKHWVIRSKWQEARRNSPGHSVTFASQTLYLTLTKGLYNQRGNWVTESQKSGLQWPMLPTDPKGNKVGDPNQGLEFQCPGGGSRQGPAWQTRIPWEPGDPAEDLGLFYDRGSISTLCL